MSNPKESSIVIVGALRNGAVYIPAVFANIYKIANKFKKYKILIYENDSTDKSREMLHEYAQKDSDISLILEDEIDKKYIYRTERLAYIRNMLLYYVLYHYSEYDYLLNLDMDDVNSTSQIADTFDHIFEYDPSIWDVQTIHQSKEYYDIWAFRKRGYIEYDCWFQVKCDLAKQIPYEVSYKNHIEKYQKPYALQRGLIPVISAFGGAGIYKIKKLMEGKGEIKYMGLCQYGEICEHVAFHEKLKNKYGARIFINPQWINKE